MLAALAAAAAVAVGVTASGHDGHDAGGRPAAGAAVHAPRIAAPRRPRRYRVPRGAVHVATGGQLRAALARNRRTTIVLAPGSYGGRRAVPDPGGPPAHPPRPGGAL